MNPKSMTMYIFQWKNKIVSKCVQKQLNECKFRKRHIVEFVMIQWFSHIHVIHNKICSFNRVYTILRCSVFCSVYVPHHANQNNKISGLTMLFSIKVLSSGRNCDCKFQTNKWKREKKNEQWCQFNCVYTTKILNEVLL